MCQLKFDSRNGDSGCFFLKKRFIYYRESGAAKSVGKVGAETSCWP